ncbi:MAG: hypothetical protein ACR2KK_01660 [Acidimicrobiales bacterium]
MLGRRLGAGVVVAAVLAVGGCSTEDKAEKVGTAPTEGATATTAKAAAQPTTFKPGDLVKIGDYQVVIHKVTDPVASTNQFLKPAAGKRWVGLDMEGQEHDRQAIVVLDHRLL